jgi:pimeloyl-ACP methyl ester carboxylesterase
MEKPSSINYEKLWKLLIRPNRDIYSENDLGSKRYKRNNNKYYTRTDYSIMSTRGFLIKCSFYEEELSTRENYIMPVVIYLHGNSSSRVEGKKMSNYLFDYNINSFIFDFPGCGLSEGNYISLGYHEKNDLKIIIDFIEKLPGVGNIGLWGRSMGAATTLLYSYCDKRIKAICIDSPFSDIIFLVKDMCYQYVKIPGFIINSILSFIKKTIKSINDTDLDDIKPIDFCERSFIPAFFIHAKYDELISYEHSLKLFEKYQGKKFMTVVDGGHNSIRGINVVNNVCLFFQKYLQ